ncbi:hypothetical protein NM688_g1869 [Phlebia brevispora]|uniref:Uncharacterized protein n=1 Tax=Phlebia brevispora TaxID=194682 RepID=A0ACC1TAJ6_9APHY|nr:hypothetical protein NM688_g1869 [Phlebia brevispora]
MLGSRTKQVFAYGRRGHRIVNVTDERQEKLSGEPPSFPKSRPEWKSRAENVPRQLSTTRTKDAVVSSDSESSYIDSSDSESSVDLKVKKPAVRKPEAAQRISKGSRRSSVRKPLSAVSANLPSPRTTTSPVYVSKKRKTINKANPMKSLKSSSPVVEMDIVVFDDRGHKISQERRVSRTNVQSNSAAQPPKKRVQKPPPGSSVEHAIVLSDNERKAPAKPRNHRQPRPIVISSDEESEEEPMPKIKLPSLQLSPESPPPRPAARRNRRPTAVLSPPTSPDIEILEEKRSSNTHIPRPKPSGSRKSTVKDSPLVPVRRQSTARVEAVFPSSLLSPPAPHFKSRRLTPLRYPGRSSLFPAPPSSIDTDDEDEDLSFDLSQLALSPRTLKQIDTAFDLHEKPPPKYLLPLLEECAQATLHEFSAFIEMFPLDPIVQTSHGGVGIVGKKGSKEPVSFQKIGEASFSEVFGIGDVVLKVIPLRDEDARHSLDSSESPPPSDAKDVLKEIVVTRAMGEVCDGFVELLRTYVVRGKYPSLLLDLWDEYNERKGSENIRPDSFTVSQVYAIIVLPNGGPDLEAYTFPSASKTGWRQATSLFWQVARTLAIAEDLVRFEHRDLHWGQILVKGADVPTQPRLSKSRKVPMDHGAHGIKVTVIDLGLSRMDSDERDLEAVHCTPFDDEVFEGEGDYQFDVYRMMKRHISNSWEAYHPLTNVMWLHYLAVKLLNAKRLRAPAVPRKSTASSIFTERECYECLVEVEQVLGAAISSYKCPATKKGRRKTQATVKPVADAGPRNAAEVLDFGIEKGWVLGIE